MRWLRLPLMIVLFAAGPAGAVEELLGYRLEAYNAPVPATLEGAAVIDTDAAFALWRSGRVPFVDVMPRPPKPDNLRKGTIWRFPPRDSIPGAIWLPNTGYGLLPPERDAYFRAGLERATAGDADAPVVIFCKAECWMSWNAAKRAVEEYGFSRVFWFPDGSDGWIAAGHPTERLEPGQ